MRYYDHSSALRMPMKTRHIIGPNDPCPNIAVVVRMIDGRLACGNHKGDRATYLNPSGHSIQNDGVKC